MASKNNSQLQAYTGKEPFLFLCFSDADIRKVRPLLERLLLRGCRVWYSTGRASDLAGQRLRSERQAGASLTVLYNTEAFAADTDAKGALLSCQERGCPIISIDTDTAANELSLGLTGAKHITRPKNAVAAEEALLHTEGFSQALIGAPGVQGQKHPARKWVALLLILTVLTAAGGFFYIRHRVQTAEEKPQDTVFFSDEALTAAVRKAAGGGALTQESLKDITSLKLDALPEDPAELQALPDLTELIISQDALLSDAEKTALLLESYTVFLTGGDK